MLLHFLLCNIILIVGDFYVYFLRSILQQQVIFANITKKEYISFHFK